ncbi:MAG TPA: rhomboid family intramembrane serine protease [Xanthobacteraceae bacterium]|nr:rhomboid family intramembrane serine protease [Xanthobacteraceae bacterium]
MTIERGRLFESPHAAVYLLLTVNVLVFALCLRQSGGEPFSGELLLRDGAMSSAAIARGEYWRLVTSGFLHANLLHLTTNMLCLALWGGHLESRVGAFYFLVVYVAALIAGGLVGALTHSGPYLSVGASGAISGILGALLCLWILAKIDLTANFFVINIGLNVALAFSARNIDWGAHLGGFAAGMLSCALIDLLERANVFVLRCKFPEFVKVNLLIGVIGVALPFWRAASTAPMLGSDKRVAVLVFLLAGALVVKLCDVLLSLKRGLAIVACAFAVANAALVWFLSDVFGSSVQAACASRASESVGEIAAALRDAVCANVTLASIVAAAVAGTLTLLLYAQQLERGIKDVGFIGASMRGERKRRRGI